ncbi:MAG: hypothetical protein P4L98_21415 [Ancalomicrobiaceae bacterium]|nr:hypothetical protein [Ancalomicrobiaceae bacterium]
MSEQLRAYLDQAADVGSGQYADGLALAASARTVADTAFTGIDAILTFAAADVAPLGFGSTGSPRFNRLWTLLGLPCLSVPGLMPDGLPLGIQLVGPAKSDSRLLAIGETLQALLAFD